MNSRVGTGQNQQISPDQVQHVLGTEQIQQLPTQAGISPEAASSKLAELVPMIMDKLIPKGRVPAQRDGDDLLKFSKVTSSL